MRKLGAMAKRQKCTLGASVRSQRSGFNLVPDFRLSFDTCQLRERHSVIDLHFSVCDLLQEVLSVFLEQVATHARTRMPGN